MKLKHYSLWALALAFAAVSCSDDLENPNKGNENSNGNGGYFMTVNIASDGSLSTKANNPNGAGWGEEGNGYLAEIENEDKVHDVNIFLFELPAINDSDPLKELNDDTKTSTPIAGRGYKALSPAMTPGGGSEPNHGKVTIEMTMNEQLTDEAKTYQVFTVVNAGIAISTINTLGDLRDWIYEKAVWSTTENKADKFLMSTHQMKGQSAGKSDVTMSNANTADKPAVTTVYVERLAARIDMQVTESLKNNSYSASGSIASSGTFKLNKFIVVNQWNGESYMIKQVSPTVNNETAAIPTTTYAETDPRKYLGDEIWVRTNATTGAGTYNYVIEPKTTTKNGSDFLSSSYINHFGPDADAENLNNTTETNKQWIGITNITTDKFTPVLYTKENTTDREQQKNGYSTGVIFESEFTAGENFKVSKYENGEIKADATVNENKSFFVALHTTTSGDLKNVVYNDVKTIAAMAFDGVSADEMTSDMYKAFMGDATVFPSGTDLAKVQGIISKMKDDNKLEAAFKKYLSDNANAEGATWENVKSNLNFAKFQENSDTGKKLVEGEDKTAYSGILYQDFGVSYYQGGKSYHKFWIRHDDNGNPNKMGVMEFAIVRNNVYQLGVTGIKDLGDPLPYTPGKDDPDTPDENSDITITVNLYVKDWVVRNNGNITLQ